MESADAFADELQARKDEILAEYRRSEGYREDVATLLRPDLEQTLAQFHDYKQFVQQIVQNLDVVLEQRYPNQPIEAKLEKATHEEVAIYHTARLMDERLDATLFMLYPDRIHEQQRTFRFAGLVTKYLKIYERRSDAKRLKVNTFGENWTDVEGNPRAIAVIPHAMIDNAIKYAPAGSRVALTYSEKGGHLDFSVESFGPKIELNERDRIFDAFYRGEAAKRVSSEGTGFGLAQAQTIANAIGTRVVAEQSDTRGAEGSFRTVFRVRLDLA